MYVYRNPYNLKNIYKMHDHCHHCGLRYQIEPSFFYGAMYISYGLTVAIGVTVFIIAKIFMGLELTASLIAIVITLILLMPITARLARNIYINMFVSFNKRMEKR